MPHYSPGGVRSGLKGGPLPTKLRNNFPGEPEKYSLPRVRKAFPLAQVVPFLALNMGLTIRIVLS